jgi:REP element-mobilizing transposase RayT
LETQLSEIGKIVDACWWAIPSHFPNAELGAFQIMPNHVHAIIEIKENPCGGLINQTPTGDQWILMKDPAITLGKIVRSFKARSTRLIHKSGNVDFSWQRSFYDHIIRSNIDHFFIHQYITN